MQGVLEKGRRANPQQCTFLDPCREMASWAELGRAGMDGPLDISQPMYPSQVAWSLQMLDFATPAQAFEGWWALCKGREGPQLHVLAGDDQEGPQWAQQGHEGQ